MPTSKLDEIVDFHRARAAADSRDANELLASAVSGPVPRDFAAALRKPGLSVIAEIKRRSPSAGALQSSLDPSALAAQYEAGGASCLSVLTDEPYFGGSAQDLRAARASVSVPVLRKDFTVDARDLMDARLMGADAVLLIVASLTDAELREFSELARTLSLTALFETHDSEEVQRAIDAGALVIGVNCRNLHTFEIDRALPEKLIDELGGVISVAESGVRNAQDARQLAAAGFDAVLVGTSLVTAAGPAEAVRALVAAGSGAQCS